jgi:hypothetical protein
MKWRGGTASPIRAVAVFDMRSKRSAEPAQRLRQGGI